MNKDKLNAMKVFQQDLIVPSIRKNISEEWKSICGNPADIAVFDSEENLNNSLTLKTIGEDIFLLITNISVGRIIKVAEDKWNFVFGKYTPTMPFDSKNMAINALTTLIEMQTIITELFMDVPFKSKTAVVKDDDGNITGVTIGGDHLLPN